MKESLYKVRVGYRNSDASVEFGFNKMSDAMEFAATCVDTIDGMDEGDALITIFHTKED